MKRFLSGLFLQTLLIISCLVSAQHLSAQSLPVVVTPIITPPYSSNLDDYANDVIVSITNLTGNAYKIKLFGSMTGDNGIEVHTNPNYHPSKSIDIGPFETYNHLPSAADEEGFFDFENLQYTATTQQEQSVLIQHLIPAGTYQYCVRAVDYDSGAPLSEDVPNGCVTLPISMSSPPFPIFPTCGNNLTDVVLPVFNWIQPDGIKPGAQLAYDFYLVKIETDDDPFFLIQQAIANGAGNPFVVTDLPVPTYDYKSYDPPLEEGESYVWAVVARDLANVMQFENGGYSPPCTFGWKLPEDPEPSVPSPNDDLCHNDCAHGGLNLDDLIDDPHAALTNNPLFNMGDFEIRMFQMAPVDPARPNQVSGLGHMNVPLIGFNYTVRLRIRFDSVILNTDRQAIAGHAKCIEMPTAPTLMPGYNDTGWDGMDLDGVDMWNLDDYIKTKWEEAKDAANVWQQTYGFEVPIGVQTGGVSVAITRLRFEPMFATMDVVALVNLNQFDPALPPVGLGIANLCISANGPCKEFKLFLPRDIPINIMNDQTGLQELTLKQSGNNYTDTFGTWMSVNADGIKNIHVEATFDFPKEMVTNLANPLVNARASLMMQADSLTDWMFRTTMTPFSVADIPDFEFYPDTAWWDFSEASNPPVFLIDSLQLEYAKFALGTEWKGFFAKHMMVKFNSPMNNNAFGKTEIVVNDLFIDELGVTVRIQANNLVSIDNGQVGSFNFSLDSINILIVNNGFLTGRLKGLALVSIADRTYTNGLINVSSNSQTSFIPYTALVTYLADDTDGDFIPDGPKHMTFDFLMHPTGGFSAPIWYATLNLADNSAITVSNNTGDGKFHASAMLNGNIGFSGNAPVIGQVNILGIAFQGFGLSSDSPYFSAGQPSFAFASPQHSAGGFPINLKEVRFVKDPQGLPGFQFDMDINLADTTMNLPKASTKFSIFGHLFDQNMKVNPGFEYATLNQICIDGKISVLEVNGCIEFFSSDPTFGDGFKGNVSVKFPSLSMGIASAIQFGNVNNMNYWYADALVTFGAGQGIPLFAGLEAYGFGGGAYYHMARQPEIPNFDLGAVAAASTGQPGFSQSGISYVPSASTALGLKAKVFFGTVKREVFNANVSLEIDFDNSGGLAHIWLDGAGRFVSDEQNPANQAAVTGEVHAEFDNINNIFQAALSADLHAYAVTGNATLEIYFEENAQNGLKWHVRFGRPVDQKWVKLTFFDLVKIEAYLEAGNFDIDPLPMLPPMFQKYLTAAEMNSVSGRKDLNGNFGMKIIHGGRVSIDVGGDFLMFYGSLKAGIGYDLMLEKLVTGCGGQGSPNGMGFKGWYAYGKAYAGIEGEIGLKLNMFGCEGRYPIAAVGAAAMLDAGFVNPSWARGKVAGYYSLFDSLIVGKFHYEFSAGQPCVPDSPDPLASIKIINEVTPKTNLTATEVTVIPAIATNLKMDMNKHMHFVQKVNGQDKHRLFRFGQHLVKAEMYKNNALQPYSNFNRQLSTDGFGLACTPTATLDRLTDYRFKYTANVEECSLVKYYPANRFAACEGTWSKAVLNGVEYKEEQTVSFKTNAGLDSIPESLIEYTFPYRLERHFVYKEYDSPKIVMSQGFNPNSYKLGPTGAQIKFKARFIPLNNAAAVTTIPVQVTPGSKTIGLTWPAELKTATYYSVQFMSEWTVAGAPANGTTSSSFTRTFIAAQHYHNAESTAVVRGRQVVEQKLALPENSKKLYEYRFRTSKYPNLAAKLGAMQADEAKYNVKAGTGSDAVDVIVSKPDLASATLTAARLRTALGLPSTGKPIMRYLPYVWMESTEKFDEHDIFGYTKTMPSGVVIKRPPFVTFEDYTVQAAHYYIKQQVFDQLTKTVNGVQLTKLDIAFNGPFGAYFDYTLTVPTVKLITWNEGLVGHTSGEGAWSNPYYNPLNPKRTIKYNTIFMGMKSPPVNVNANGYMANIVVQVNPNPTAYMQFLQQLGLAYDQVQVLWNAAFNAGTAGANLTVPYNGGSLGVLAGGN